MADQKKPDCRFGAKCYRKNADHLKKFRHPPKDGHDSAPENENGESEKLEEPHSKRRRRNTEETEVTQRKAASPVREEKNEDEEKPEKEDSNSSKDSDFVPMSASYDDRKNVIKQYLLFDMPDDFYALWNLALSLNSEDPREAFNGLGLVLCGPFDVMAGKLDIGKVGAEELLVHCRYYYDVPEFQTVIRETATDGEEEPLFHIGYLRDESTNDAIVCSNDGKNCKLTILGDNLFSAISDFAKSKSDDGDKDDVSELTKAILTAAEKGGFSLDKNSRKVKDRKKKTVTNTFHGAGIVVPMEGDVGYRPLGVTDDQLKKTLQHFDPEKKSKDDEKLRESASSKLQELVTFVQFANDECDFGMGYELGIDLFCTGFPDLHPYIDQLLSVAYTLLHREQFKTILNAHSAKRRRGTPFNAA